MGCLVDSYPALVMDNCLSGTLLLLFRACLVAADGATTWIMRCIQIDKTMLYNDFVQGVCFMRKRYLLTSVISAVVICFASVLIAVSINKNSEYILSEAQCKTLFTKTPKEFVENPCPLDLFNEWSGITFCETAEIDANGNLRFTLTDQQREQWRNTKSVKNRIDSALANSDISISPDYKKMSIRCYRETASKNIGDGISASYACNVLQLLNGISPTQVNVEISLIDARTGGIVSLLISDLETSKIGPYSKDHFSSMYD